ncbi:hypothetical protein CSUI_008556 [Cystoisospora suis]|uniref:Uncharacterized protein n=1 Tax=Cystoisospora suis TaxID=483139 RepID=A0A2C6KMD6_9APIC|nr:hypothetical protein CSUI_008556 [Cystoisospora suis]
MDEVKKGGTRTGSLLNRIKTDERSTSSKERDGKGKMRYSKKGGRGLFSSENEKKVLFYLDFHGESRPYETQHAIAHITPPTLESSLSPPPVRMHSHCLCYDLVSLLLLPLSEVPHDPSFFPSSCLYGSSASATCSSSSSSSISFEEENCLPIRQASSSSFSSPSSSLYPARERREKKEV